MLVVLVDDERTFKDGRDHRVARTSAQGLALLRSLRGQRVDELWLDHDLGIVDGELDDISPVVKELERAAVWDEPYDVGVVYVHTTNSSAAAPIVLGLSNFHVVRRVVVGDHLEAVPGLRSLGSDYR